MPGHLPQPKHLVQHAAVAYAAGRASVLPQPETLAMLLCALVGDYPWRTGRYATCNNQWYRKAKRLRAILLGGQPCKVYCQDTGRYIQVL